ncbi:MAG: DUF177 domain-containing protein [Bacteroidetes bacterium]|nr:DUF177 domain-containing protein [Bacteroidota bacterium]
MIHLDIQGLHDGVHLFDFDVPVSDIPLLSSEFIGTVHVEGRMQKRNRRYDVEWTASATARLVCDRSLEEFDEQITVDEMQEYVADSQQFYANMDTERNDDGQVIPIRDDATVIDITDEVRQELMVHLPMRRVAPKYRDKELTELFPELEGRDAEAPQPDVAHDQWAALRKLKDI